MRLISDHPSTPAYTKSIACLVLFLSACCQLFATTTITGNIKTLGTTSGNNSFIRFWLRGCNGNQPRVNGVAIVPSNTNGQFYFDFPTNSVGAVSGSLYSTRDAAGTGAGEIDCGGSHTAAWYGMQVFRNSVGGPETPVHAKNTGTLDVSNVTPTSTNPVVVAPTGDSTYARLDAGNQPFTGTVQAPGGILTAITTQSVNNAIYATPGETVAHAVARLPVGGGKVIFGIGVYPSGGVGITTPNIWLEGAGMPNYNSATAPTALTGGTIFQGPVSVAQGGDHFVIRNAGIDVGPTWINANNGGVATTGLVLSNNGQIVGAPQVKYPIIENVSCLGYSLSAAQHCLLVENVLGAYVHNVQTVMNQHGLAFKGEGSVIDGVFARGHSIDAVIIKSDTYAPADNDVVRNIVVAPLATAGDTKGVVLQSIGAPLLNIQVSQVDVSQALSWGIQVQGTSSTNSASSIQFSDVIINYAGLSPTSHSCIQFVQYVTSVHMDNVFCQNYWAGITFSTPISGFTNDFSLSNSHFVNIATNGVETYGRWEISNSGFIGITGTAITADANSLANVSANQFFSNGTDVGGAGAVTNLATSFAIHSASGDGLICSGVPPTITSGFNAGTIGASPNGSCAFFVTVGVGTAGSGGVLALPAAKNGWNCFANNFTRADHIQQTANTATSATFTNYGTTFAATNWTNGDVITISCLGR
jgi:hypothetical protein